MVGFPEVRCAVSQLLSSAGSGLMEGDGSSVEDEGLLLGQFQFLTERVKALAAHEHSLLLTLH